MEGTVRLLTALIVVGLAAGTARAAERVDLELVLLADASGSIDKGEIRFQRQGYDAAITHPEVLAAISQGFSQRIAVTFVEWGSEGSQEVVVPWTVVDGTGDRPGVRAGAAGAASPGLRHERDRQRHR